jgi:hypothetical protein
MRLILVTLLVVAIGAAFSPQTQAATIFTLDQDACTGTCGGPVFGTVQLDQTTATLVTITVTLAANELFAGTGTGAALAFNVNPSIAGLVISNISPGASFALGGAIKSSAYGNFLESIACATCQGGNATNPSGPLSFTVTAPGGVTIADFTSSTAPNGSATPYYFASDIVGANGNTGNVGALIGLAPGPDVPEPLPVLLIGMGLAALGVLRTRFRG